MSNPELKALIEGVQHATHQHEPCAIATIVKVIGSAYRREGTKMLIRKDGSYSCLLSGGCLEPEIVHLAEEVMISGIPTTARYNLDEEMMFGLGIGCVGDVEVYIEPYLQNPVQNAWLQALAKGEQAALITPLKPENGRLLILSTGEQLGELHPELQEAVIFAKEQMHKLHPKAKTLHFAQQEVFIDFSVPAPKLFIFGAGHDAIPLSNLAVHMGFEVHVVDMRDQFATSGRFAHTTLHVLRTEDFHTLPVDERSFVLVLNHHFLVDQATLWYALQTPAVYIGLLGPRVRFEKVQEGLKRDGFSLTAEQVARVCSPIGLNIGAESPEEVALSVVSELLAVYRGYGGGFLNGLSGKIHHQAVLG